MLPRLITLLLVIVGIINFVPVIGILSADQLNAMYAIAVNDPSLEILLRHRAILFGLLGGFILYAAFNRPAQPAAIVVSLVAMLGFVVLVRQIDADNRYLSKVAMVDAVASVLAIIAALAYLIHHKASDD